MTSIEDCKVIAYHERKEKEEKRTNEQGDKIKDGKQDMLQNSKTTATRSKTIFQEACHQLVTTSQELFELCGDDIGFKIRERELASHLTERDCRALPCLALTGC